jgi:hypothetical protein
VLENRVLKGILETKTGEVIGGWGKVRNEDINNLQ